MAFNWDTLIIDHIASGTLTDKSTGEVIFTANQITNPVIEIGGEQVFVTNALGSRIATFDRQKTTRFSAENSQINLGIFAAQMGKTKEIASMAKPITSPMIEILTVGETGGTPKTTLVLKNVPTGTAGAEISYIYRINSDSSIADTFTLDDTADATHYTLAAASKTITLPVIVGEGAIKATDRFFVKYQYSATSAVKITNSAENFAMGGVFTLMTVFADYCNPNTKYYGYIVFPSVKLDPSSQITLSNEATHAFAFEAMLDNCSNDKEMFSFIIPE